MPEAPAVGEAGDAVPGKPDGLREVGDAADAGRLEEIERAVGVVAQKVGEEREVAESVVPVSGALLAGAVLGEGVDERLHGAEDGDEGGTQARGVALLVEERGADGTRAHGSPVVVPAGPPRGLVGAEVAVEDAVAYFRADARGDARVHAVAEEVERLGEVEARLGREEVEHVAFVAHAPLARAGAPEMGGNRPGELVARLPHRVLERGEESAVRVAAAEDGGEKVRETDAAGEEGLLEGGAVAGVAEQAELRPRQVGKRRAERLAGRLFHDVERSGVAGEARGVRGAGEETVGRAVLQGPDNVGVGREGRVHGGPLRAARTGTRSSPRLPRRGGRRPRRRPFPRRRGRRRPRRGAPRRSRGPSSCRWRA